MEEEAEGEIDGLALGLGEADGDIEGLLEAETLGLLDGLTLGDAESPPPIAQDAKEATASLVAPLKLAVTVNPV